MLDEGKVLYYLDLWREYMKFGGNSKLGYPNKSAGFLSGGIHSFDDWGNENDFASARIVHMVINELPALPREAIEFAYLGHKSKLSDEELKLHYDSAIERLRTKLYERHLF
jgi:hypothetical protein